MYRKGVPPVKKKLLALSQGQEHENIILISYCNTKLIGTVYDTLTGLPRCFPGFHLGRFETTRNASLSIDGSTPLAILASETLPSLSTTKVTYTFPSIPFSCAITGYLIELAINLRRASSPPGNSGMSSTIKNT